MHPFNSKFLVTNIATTALVACSSPSQGADEAVPGEQGPQLVDKQYLVTLREEFLEVSGKDFVEFQKGSAVLGPSAEFRLERQAVWLRAYPMISIRLIASGDGLERVADRRLAMARGLAVQKHLTEFGVLPHQISGIDVAAPTNQGKQTVTTKLDPIQSAFNGCVGTDTPLPVGRQGAPINLGGQTISDEPEAHTVASIAGSGPGPVRVALVAEDEAGAITAIGCVPLLAS